MSTQRATYTFPIDQMYRPMNLIIQVSLVETPKTIPTDPTNTPVTLPSPTGNTPLPSQTGNTQEQLLDNSTHVQRIRYKAGQCSVVTLNVLGRTNEQREVTITDTAAYRTDKAEVVQIETVHGGDPISETRSIFDPSFKYETGKIVETNFNPNLEETFTSGVHYYKTKEAAEHRALEHCMKEFTGMWKFFDTKTGVHVSSTKYNKGARESMSWHV